MPNAIRLPPVAPSRGAGVSWGRADPFKACHRSPPGAARCGLSLLLLLLAGLPASRRAEAGHESSWYPAFYPQEIRIEAVDQGGAAALLQKNGLHAYVGENPFPSGSLPAPLKSVESLGSYVVATFNPASPSFREAGRRCAVAREVQGSVTGVPGTFVVHPYPVTPYHADYLDHYDLAQGRRRAADQPPKGRPTGEVGARVRAAGRLAEALGRGRWTAADTAWDVAVEEVEAAGLAAPAAPGLLAGLGPPWAKAGWFQAYRLLAGAIQDAARTRRVEAMVQRLTGGPAGDPLERINLERALVGLLGEGCERVVLGYTLRRGTVNDDYSEGIENVGLDSHLGLLSPIFLRTVKLKDLPWNGWLRLGIGARPTAAWNPVAGFADPFGRWVWFAVGDPALFPAPSGASWISNRVTATAAPGGPRAAPVEIPPDALVPAPGTGAFRPVGPRQTAQAKVLYRSRLSAFHDGTRMATADLIYPYAFAARWGAPRGRGGPAPEPAVAESTALMRAWLAGFKILRVERAVKDLLDLKLEWQVPVIEVYLRHGLEDPQQTAAVAPPWSSVPWHVLALMEEAVGRGFAAFSQQEAKRRGVAWLDLVRDGALQGRLMSLAEEFERTAYVPEALKAFVTAQEARGRWAALRQFAQKYHHFLVTNGPYRLEQWSADSATLPVFRDLSYPLGVGTFDQYVLPPKAHLAEAGLHGRTLLLAVTVEKAMRAGRSYTWTTEPLTKDAATEEQPVRAAGRYVVVAADGTVRGAGDARPTADGGLRAELPGLPSGRYTILTAAYLNGNTVEPDVRRLEHRVP
ncbi:MAG TPA: hypothetical protein VED18_11265 [Candidatus Sulfotelmatobacter sp.]|nr:hypothetical protein [Candidatus Sulfotelmatobacter sp.]